MIIIVGVLKRTNVGLKTISNYRATIDRDHSPIIVVSKTFKYMYLITFIVFINKYSWKYEGYWFNGQFTTYISIKAPIDNIANLQYKD